MENEKINLQQLAKTLALEKGISQRKAETFLREFFDAIVQNVTIDKHVKVKGLGTFKLIEVLDRESVDVTTGERIVIPGHSKLSFTADASLKDMVNKPFADFQTVIINEGTDLKDMEGIPEEVEQETEAEDYLPEEAASDKQEETIEPEPVPSPEPEPEPAPAPELEPEPTPEPESEPNPESEVASMPEPDEESELMLEGVDVEDEISPFAPAKVRAMTTAEKCALTLGVILLCVLSYFAGYYRMFDSLKIVPHKKEAPKKSPAETLVAKKDTVAVVAVQKKDTVAVSPSEEPKTAFDPSIKYRITGTRGTYVMKSGDYLAKIALEEYGDKDFARYIIAHNKFPNPDNVPVGQEVKLPELEEVK